MQITVKLFLKTQGHFKSIKSLKLFTQLLVIESMSNFIVVKVNLCNLTENTDELN